MHIAAFETGSLGALAVVGSGIPLAVGAALAFKMRGEDRVAVPFTGDAGSNTGNWHEGLNMASIWDLPVVFVLENNHYGVSTHIEDVIKVQGPVAARRWLRHPGRARGWLRCPGSVRGCPSRRWRAPARGEGPTLLVTEILPLRGALRRRAGSVPLAGGGGGVPQEGSHPALPRQPDQPGARLSRLSWSTSTRRSSQEIAGGGDVRPAEPGARSGHGHGLYLRLVRRQRRLW